MLIAGPLPGGVRGQSGGSCEDPDLISPINRSLSAIKKPAGRRVFHRVSAGRYFSAWAAWIPVNDLSRGALVDDIVYTIALTGIQAAQAE